MYTCGFVGMFETHDCLLLLGQVTQIGYLNVAWLVPKPETRKMIQRST